MRILIFIAIILLLAPPVASAQPGSPPLPWYVETTVETSTRQSPVFSSSVIKHHEIGATMRVCFVLPGLCQYGRCSWLWRCDGRGFVPGRDIRILGIPPGHEAAWTDVLLAGAR